MPQSQVPFIVHVKLHISIFLSILRIYAAFTTTNSYMMIPSSVIPMNARNMQRCLSSLSLLDIQRGRRSRSRSSFVPRTYYRSLLSSVSQSIDEGNGNSNGFDGICGNVDQIETELSIINKKVEELTGSNINLNSPKQIASALYNQTDDDGNGNRGGTSKEVLQQLTNRKANDPLCHSVLQKDLATLVLQHRVLKSRLQRMKSDNTLALDTSFVHAHKSMGTSFSSGQLQYSTISNATYTGISKEGTQDYSGKVLNDASIRPGVNKIRAAAKSTKSLAFNGIVDELLSPSMSSSKIDSHWFEPLLSVAKPSARALISQLHPDCPIGYDPTATPFGNDSVRTKTAGKKGSLLGYVREQKEKYSDMIILTRVGEFYESFGIDAVLLVEHCGLNAMAGKARAGCPLKNIQATLDGLTNAGFRVAVYEEANDTGSGRGGNVGKSKIKNRMLAQIVSPANPTYLYDLVLGDSGSTRDALFSSPSARPYIGIVHSSSGYTILEVSTEERTVRVTERVTAEAVACCLASYPPADPLFYVPSKWEEESGDAVKRNLPFLPSRWETERDGPGSKAHVTVLPPSVYMASPIKGSTEIDRLKKCILGAIFRATEKQDDDQSGALSFEDFTTLLSDDVSEDQVCTFTNPLYVETATQLGLMTDPTIPTLIRYLVPDIAPLPTRKFLRKWLLTPPPPKVTSSMWNLVAYLKDDSASMPLFEIPPIGKVLSLIRAGQASAQIFREVLISLESTVSVLKMHEQDEKDKMMITSLIEILKYESGIAAVPDNLINRCLDAIQVIEEIVTTDEYGMISIGNKSNQSEFGDILPPAFFDRNEASWRGRIKPEASREAYDSVENASLALIKAVAIDFWGAHLDDFSAAEESKSPIVQDIFNNLILLKAVPSWSNEQDKYFHPRDRNGKILRNRYTTQRVDDAISSYVEACEIATKAVSDALTDLSETLCNTGHLPAVTQAGHVNLILATACQHAEKSNQLGWNLAMINDDTEIRNDDASCKFVDLHPYWMDSSEAALNSFDLDSLFLLTAPNMSGKSTIMRSAAAAALLTTCGFSAPVGLGSSVTRFDSIFVRGASSDVPSENKSAFGAEMGDIAALLRACGKKSLVFVDELGRGTSPEDGTSLAGAVLEAMAERGMCGFFATHLHSILDLPLRENAMGSIRYKRMEILEKGEDFHWTYRLEDGICKDSRALKTASQFGIPQNIIDRAEQLSFHLKSNNNELSRASISLPKEPPVTPKPSNQSNSVARDKETSFDSIVDMMKELSGEDLVKIKPRWSSPPSYEGSSVVYVLQVGNRFYVGETDALSQRIRQHRQKGGEWATSATVAVKIRGGKSNARNLESRLIQKIGQSGYDLLSTTDGRKIKPLQR